MRTELYTTLFALIALSTSLAMTPQEQRKLIGGLSDQNDELRGIVTEQKAQIEKFSTDAVFAQAKIDSLTGRLAESKKLEGDQVFELGLQQAKIKDQADALDKQTKRADSAESIAAKKTAEAHRNATERDLCLYALALAVTVLVLTCAGQIIGWIIRIYPAAAPYGALIEIGLAVGTFAATYGAGRGFLALVASRL